LEKIKILTILLCLFAAVGPGCRKTSNISQGPSPTGLSPEALTESLKLKSGMQIRLKQGALAWGDQWIPLPAGQFAQRSLSILNPSNAEGLAFGWTLKVPLAGTPTPESAPSGLSASPQLQIKGWEGKMTLANATDSRRLTLPAFWPDGELYLSNASAIWLSDRAYEELKKTRQTEWGAGVLQNPLVGPLQGLELLEKGLSQLQNQVEQSPESIQNAGKILAEKKLGRYSLKVNGADREVEVVEAKNWLAEYKILNNAQNPLILQVRFLPEASAGSRIFSPLSPLQSLLEYEVTEIDLPKDG
jgi:hypothetical protein